MKKVNNKGFTLVELVIATAILSVISLTVLTLMTSGTNMYSGIQKRSNVLFKSQVASTQLEEILVNVGSDDGIAVVDKDLYIVDKDDSKITRFSLDSTLSRLNMYEGTVEAEVTAENQTFNYEWSDPIPFSSDIIDVTYSPHYNKDGGVNYAYAFGINLTVSKGGITYDKNSLASLRNKPKFASGETAVQDLLELVFNH